MNKENRNAAAGRLRAFLDRVEQAYRAGAAVKAEDRKRLLSLTLAVTGLDDWLIGQGRARPLQVAVIGPTQVGKSTVVNLLLGAEQAEASPLAAYTKKLYGFGQSNDQVDAGWIVDVLSDATLTLQAAERPRPVDFMLWDTPDFDSHRSHTYRELIAQVSALADIFVLVVSKEKYADLTVWQMLKLIQPLDRTLIICLNKVSADEEVLKNALLDRLSEFAWNNVPVFTLPYITADSAFKALAQTEQVVRLKDLVFGQRNLCSDKDRLQGIQRLITLHWDDWLRPIREEISAVDDWRDSVGRCVKAAQIDYRAQYLAHDHHDDAFNQTILQLLALLEIPGLSAPLSKIRRVLTWPARKILAQWRNQSGMPAQEQAENVILVDIIDHALLDLRMVVTRNAAERGQVGRWWMALSDVYQSEADGIRDRLPAAVGDYQQAFAPEIERAASLIHERLQENPVVLNALRATRLSADLAGVVVAVKTGTMGISEALLTPAMLSVTSILTESAVGKYVDSVREQLKEKQYMLVEELLHEQFANPMLDLGLDLKGLFNISERKLDRAQSAAKALLE